MNLSLKGDGDWKHTSKWLLVVDESLHSHCLLNLNDHIFTSKTFFLMSLCSLPVWNVTHKVVGSNSG